jgi:hypothetical protein
LKDACRIMNLKVFKIAIHSEIIEENDFELEEVKDDGGLWYGRVTDPSKNKSESVRQSERSDQQFVVVEEMDTR